MTAPPGTALAASCASCHDCGLLCRLPGAHGYGVRCPRCGGRGLFASAFTIRRVCPTCELPLEREDGGFLGAMSVNYTVTALAFVALLVVWLAVDLPDVNTAGLILASAAVAVVVPLLFFRSAKVIWTGVDYLVWRTQPGYVPRAR